MEDYKQLLPLDLEVKQKVLLVVYVKMAGAN